MWKNKLEILGLSLCTAQFGLGEWRGEWIWVWNRPCARHNLGRKCTGNGASFVRLSLCVTQFQVKMHEEAPYSGAIFMHFVTDAENSQVS